MQKQQIFAQQDLDRYIIHGVVLFLSHLEIDTSSMLSPNQTWLVWGPSQDSEGNTENPFFLILCVAWFFAETKCIALILF